MYKTSFVSLTTGIGKVANHCLSSAIDVGPVEAVPLLFVSPPGHAIVKMVKYPLLKYWGLVQWQDCRLWICI